MEARQLLEIVQQCTCGKPEVTQRLTRIAFQVAEAQKQVDAQIARDAGHESLAVTIETTE